MIGTRCAPSSDRYLELTGEIDARTVPGIIDAALAPADGRDLVVDLAGVEFIDAAGLGGLITIRTRLNSEGGRLSIVGARPRVARTFTLGGAEFLLLEQPADAGILDQFTAAVVGAVRAAARAAGGIGAESPAVG